VVTFGTGPRCSGAHIVKIDAWVLELLNLITNELTDNTLKLA